jgi:hypothetical protein
MSAMIATKLVLDEELARLADLRGPASAEAYVLLELREARSHGEKVFAFRNPDGRYTVGPIEVLTTELVRSQRKQQTQS